MAFEFVCPFCHTRIRVDDRYAGLSGPCAECGKQVTMPGRKDTHANEIRASIVKSETQKIFRLPRSRSRTFIRSSLSLVFIGCAVGLLSVVVLPSFRKALALRQRTLGLANVKQIADALNEYYRAHGSYPTPIVVDASGKPLYSWRVLILPQLGYSSLYNEYQLDQAWDSPTNISHINRMPPVYACPNNSVALSMRETNFALIVGPSTMFPKGTPVDPKRMLDKPSETLLVVETKESVATWTQPGDLDTNNGIAIGSRPMRDIGGNYPDCVIAVTVDGTPLAINPTIPQASLDAIISPNGKETVELSKIRIPQ